MDPSHFRGPQPPASHVVPGAPGAPAHPPHFGFMEPQLLIPAAFLNETLMAIRTESAAQTRLLANHYSNLKQDYNGIREDFRSCVHQTDRILAEQYSRFELKLEDIQKSMLQFHENQTAAIADLRARLDAIEGLTKCSKDAVASKITAIVETMGRGIDGLLAVIKPNVCDVRDTSSFESGVPRYNASLEAFLSFPEFTDGPPYAGNTEYEPVFDHSHGVKETLIPVTPSQADSEVNISTAHAAANQSSLEFGEVQEDQLTQLPPVTVLPDPESPPTSTDNPEVEEQDELYEMDTPMISTPATDDHPSVPPTGDVTIVPASPPTILPVSIPTTPVAECDPLQDPLPQDSLFDAPSPLTPVSTPQSQDQEEPQAPVESPGIETYTMLADPGPRKRKRASQGHGALKRTRRNRKSRAQEKQDDFSCQAQQSEGDHADPSIWPPVIEDDASTQKYVGCDRCAQWYHFGCVGLRADSEDGLDWECPPCVQDATRDAADVPREGGEMCARPGCPNPRGGEFFMERLLGRCYVPDQDVVKYLVAYEGYELDQCTWEPPESFSNDSSKIDEFLGWWETENPGVDVESLDPHDTIFLHRAFVLARAGITWPGGISCSFTLTPTPPPS